ncbi:hypothetical protein [Schaalia suimastitidis]|uniref:hypothetical protein n=1 Tax=Schaalia suimastitidis TaxID=121163 RepID=UPI0004181999|nr:hypothetical protein [Schaalia suimastitidis]
MSDSLFVDQEVLGIMARRHRDVATEIQEHANQMPTFVDGGIGTAYILLTTATVAAGLGDIARWSQGAADAIDQTVEDFAQVDSTIADAASQMRGSLP